MESPNPQSTEWIAGKTRGKYWDTVLFLERFYRHCFYVHRGPLYSGLVWNSLLMNCAEAAGEFGYCWVVGVSGGC